MFDRLPVDVQLKVLLHSSKTYGQASDTICSQEWKHDLRFLAICRGLRTAVVGILYRTVFLHIDNTCHVRPSQVGFKGRSHHIIHRSNVDLIEANGLCGLVRRADIDVTRKATAAVRLKCLVHAITKEFVEDKDVQTAAIQAISLFAQRFSRVNEIGLCFFDTSGKMVSTLHALCSQFADELRAFSYRSRVYFRQPLKFTRAERLHIRVDSNDQLQTLAVDPRELRYFKLQMVFHRLDWLQVFGGNNGTSTVVFPNLEELDIWAVSYFQGRFGRNPQMPCTLSFPRLRTLAVSSAHLEDHVARALLQSPVAHLRLSSLIDEIIRISRLGVSKLTSLSVRPSFEYTETSQSATEKVNQLMRLVQGIPYVRMQLDTRPTQCDFGSARWPHLTHLQCSGIVELDKVLANVEKMPDLVCLELMVGAWRGDGTNEGLFFKTMGLKYTAPFVSRLEYLRIAEHRLVVDRAIRSAKDTIRELFPCLKSIVLNDEVLWNKHERA